MNCRGREKRKRIVENYEVVPVAHLQLLNGQTKRSDAGAVIKNSYYIFSATHKGTGKKEIIQCGIATARDFLRLLDHDGVKLFNPLNGNNENNGGVENNRNGNRVVWNTVAKQLYHAIMWLIVILDATPNTPIFELRNKVLTNEGMQPTSSQIRGVNTIITRGCKGQTLTDVIDSFKVNNAIRDVTCQFNLLIELINNAVDTDGNPILSMF